jgi:hypothetical protein
MSAKSEKQRNFIFALRNRYKSRKKTPWRWKWVWGEDWTKLENTILRFDEFNQLNESVDF